MRQREQRGLPYVLGEHVRPPGPGGQRGRGARHHDVGPHAVHLERGAGRRDLPQRPVPEPHRRQQLPRRDDPLPYGGLLVGPPRGEGGGVVVVGEPPPYDLDALVRLPGRGHLDGQAEAVQQLRSQLALFRVHGADQQEPCRVPHRHALALDVRGAHRRRVQQQVDQVVMEQIDLVDVQNAPVRGGQQPRLERLHALRQRPLDVEGADQPVLGGADGQLHHARGPRSSAALVRPVRARRVGREGVAGEPATRHHRDLRQQRGQRTHRGRLGGALLAAHQHTADGRRHRVQQQREPQVVLTDNGRERKGGGHWSSPSESPSRSPSSSR